MASVCLYLFALLSITGSVLSVRLLPPLPPRDHAKVARELVHKSDWASIGTISSEITGYPMVNILSISDSPKGENSTGNIYFLMTDLDFSSRDWRKHNNVTLTITSEQDGTCQNKGLDAMEPTCPRCIIFGSVEEIASNASDYEVGWNSFISRHPAGKLWSKQHDFYLAKMNISYILVLDWYGGVKNVTAEQYYSGSSIVPLPPLPPRNHAKVARELVHKSDWASIGTISSEITGYPMVNILSIADSAKGQSSTGNIFFLMTDLDFSSRDWRKHNYVTLTITSEQDGSCQKQGIDAMEPTCPRCIIFGNVQEIATTSSEYNVGWNSFISRHPAGKVWVKNHDFYLAKLNISNILVLDWYGGVKNITADEYYNVSSTAIPELIPL